MIKNQNSTPANGISARLASWLDHALNRMYRSPKTAAPPANANREIWSAEEAIKAAAAADSAGDYFLSHFQSQQDGPTPNECVTTCVLMAMNIMQDLAGSKERPLLHSHRRLRDYTAMLDSLGVRGWFNRFSTTSPLPGMMTPWQGIFTLRHFSRKLAQDTGRTVSAHLSSGQRPQDLIRIMKDGGLILLHGAWRVTLNRNETHLPHRPLQAMLGGMPHTMLLAGYDAPRDEWLFLNPSVVQAEFFKMNTASLMEFWGRIFIFYPRRYSITTINLKM